MTEPHIVCTHPLNTPCPAGVVEPTPPGTAEPLLSEHLALSVTYGGQPLLSGPLPTLAALARMAANGEVFPPIEYRDPYDPAHPDDPRPIRRVRIILQEA